MNLDTFTLAALTDQFLDVLAGGRVQDTLDVDEYGVGLEIYGAHKRRYLYLSADNSTPRLHLLDEKLRRGLNRPTQIGLMLRRYVETGIVTHISQPPWERVMQIDVRGPEGDVSLVIEPIERRSNLLLLQNGTILDCVRRVGPDENRYRVSLPAQSYVPPPPIMGKRHPAEVTAEVLAALLAAETDPKRKAHQTLTAHILGVSPLLAKELIYRANGDSNAKPAAVDVVRLARAFTDLLPPLLAREWQAGIAETDGRVSAFSVYPLTSVGGWRAVADVSTALTAYYGAPIGEEAYTAAKVPLQECIDDAMGRLRGKLASLQSGLTDDSAREVLRQSGELILAYQYTLAKDQTSLTAQYDPDQPPLTIALNPTLTALENAQTYFERYQKAKRALEDVPRLIAETEAQAAYLAQLATDLQLAANRPEIDEVQQHLQSGGYWRGKTLPRSNITSGPLRLVSRDGFVLWVGRNSRQNDLVTFGKGGKLDLWLHARGVAGAHVLIRFDGRPIPEALIEQAAALAAHYSAARGEAKVIVDVTQVRYVSKIRGGGPGMVTYRNETTRTVAPRDKDVLAE
jgi:predicted ribosome quality control (RQC) complex YloA/Tae2 family protein